MFFALTASGGWFADIPSSSFVVNFLSSYKLQFLRVATPILGALKPVADVSKVLLGIDKFKGLNEAYGQIRYKAIKIVKFFKDIISNKRTTAVLAGLATASTLIGGTSLGGFPIILCGAGAAFAAYRGEQRKEAIEATTKEADVGTISLTNGYDQGNTVKSKGISYPWPHPMELMDKALDLAMAGIIAGTSSIGFVVTVVKVTYSIISEVKDYASISKLKKTWAARIRPEDRKTPASHAQQEVDKKEQAAAKGQATKGSDLASNA